MNAFKVLKLILIIVLLAVSNAFICSAVSGVVFLLLTSYGVTKELTLVLSTISAIYTYIFIIFNYNIRQFI